MIGCLFRLVTAALMILLLVAGWLYRDRLLAEANRLVGRAEPGATGAPSDAALARARRLTATLADGADSVVLGPDAAASLVAAGLPAGVRARIDSLTVGLDDGRVAVTGSVEMGRLPADLVGPLSMVLRDRERVTVGGPLVMAGPGTARWTLDDFALRGVPLPRDAVPRLVVRALGDDSDGTVALRLPPAVSGLRVEPQGIILYRDARP